MGSSLEKQFHKWLSSRIPRGGAPAHLLVGVGDDAAVIEVEGREWVVATDSIAHGTHFVTDEVELELIGRKCMAVNLSDLAAMAAIPKFALLNFQIPNSMGLEDAKKLFHGAEEIGSEFGIQIIGGDTNRWNGPLVVGATVIGERSSGFQGWRLDGARANDLILVSGEFGGSIHGRHLSFTPRVDLALRLADHCLVNGATDVSDSLSLDLFAMCQSSQLGAELQADQIPISRNVQTEIWSRKLEAALNDGEDFELLLAVSGQNWSRVPVEIQNEFSVIGKFVESPPNLKILNQGSWEPVCPTGYIH